MLFSWNKATQEDVDIFNSYIIIIITNFYFFHFVFLRLSWCHSKSALNTVISEIN